MITILKTLFKAPDFRGVIAILTAGAVALDKAIPSAGGHWGAVVSAAIGAALVHWAPTSPASFVGVPATSASAGGGTSAAAPSSTAAAGLTSSSTPAQ